MATPLIDGTLKSESTAIEFRKRMKELKTNPRRVAAEIDFAYDTVRKVYNGVAFPGPKLLAALCDYLTLDLNLMKELVNIDKAADKGWTAPMDEHDPVLVDIRKYWPHLNKKDRLETLEIVKLKANRLTVN